MAANHQIQLIDSTLEATLHSTNSSY